MSKRVSMTLNTVVYKTQARKSAFCKIWPACEKHAKKYTE
jgi:hypothetical protein